MLPSVGASPLGRGSIEAAGVGGGLRRIRRAQLPLCFGFPQLIFSL